MAARLHELALEGGENPTPLLAVRDIFSEQLASTPRFVNRVRELLKSFYTNGAKATLAQILVK